MQFRTIFVQNIPFEVNFSHFVRNKERQTARNRPLSVSGHIGRRNATGPPLTTLRQDKPAPCRTQYGRPDYFWFLILSRD